MNRNYFKKQGIINSQWINTMRRNCHSHQLEHRKRYTRTDCEKQTRGRGEKESWEKSERRTAWSRTEIEKKKAIFCGWENTYGAALGHGLACKRGSTRMRSSLAPFSSYYASIVVHVSQWRLWNPSERSGTEIRLSREITACRRWRWTEI